MKHAARRIFLDHPHCVGETFTEHFCFALKFSATLFVAAFAALIHALIPALCEKTASTKIAELHRRMNNRLS